MKDLHPLIDREGKLIPEENYGDIEGIIQQYLHKYITPQENEGLKTQKLINYKI